MSSDKPINSNTAPNDQVRAARSALKHMNDTVDRLADEQVAKGTKMTPKS